MYHSTNVRQGPGSIELPRSRAPAVKANALLYAHFERPDLNRARDYLVDFGLLGRLAKRGRTLPARSRLDAVHLSRQSRRRGAVHRLRTVRPLRRRPEGAGEGVGPFGRSGRRAGRRLRRAPRRPARRRGQRPSWLRRGRAGAGSRAHSLQCSEPDGSRQRYAASGAGAAAGDEARAPRARDARLRPQRTLVYGHAGLHSVRRDVPCGRNPGRVVHAPRPRRRAERPSHAVRRDRPRIRRPITSPSRSSTSMRWRWASRS